MYDVATFGTEWRFFVFRIIIYLLIIYDQRDVCACALRVSAWLDQMRIYFEIVFLSIKNKYENTTRGTAGVQ